MIYIFYLKTNVMIYINNKKRTYFQRNLSDPNIRNTISLQTDVATAY